VVAGESKPYASLPSGATPNIPRWGETQGNNDENPGPTPPNTGLTPHRFG